MFCRIKCINLGLVIVICLSSQLIYLYVVLVTYVLLGYSVAFGSLPRLVHVLF